MSYLTETSASGNVVKGFENYLRAQARPHRRVAEADIESQRIFSRSSLTHLKVPPSHPCSIPRVHTYVHTLAYTSVSPYIPHNVLADIPGRVLMTESDT